MAGVRVLRRATTATSARTAATAAAGLCLLAAVSGCAVSPGPSRASPATGGDVPSAPAPAAAEDTADALLAGLSRLCGQAFAGEVEVDTPTPATSAFADRPLVMHVRACGHDPAGVRTVRVPFHVGDDHSRTWVFTRTATGLRLKHDHRHADGSPDAITLYGGDAVSTPVGAAPGLRLEFPVDAESVAMFQAGGLAASVRNTWAVELSERRFVYELARPDGRLFRVGFDLTRPVPAPPAPWGTSAAD